MLRQKKSSSRGEDFCISLITWVSSSAATAVNTLTKGLGMLPWWSCLTGCEVCLQLFLFSMLSIWKCQIFTNGSRLQRSPYLPPLKRVLCRCKQDSPNIHQDDTRVSPLGSFQKDTDCIIHTQIFNSLFFTTHLVTWKRDGMWKCRVFAGHSLLRFTGSNPPGPAREKESTQGMRAGNAGFFAHVCYQGNTRDCSTHPHLSLYTSKRTCASMQEGF